jgi:WD repeat-containing protein 42A
MNLASGLAQREREGPLWSLPHRLGAKTTFVVPPPPGPSRQRSRSASSSSDSSYEDESSSQPTTASSASDPAPLQPQQSDSVTDPPGNSAAAEGSLWRLHKPTSSTQLFRANSSFVSRLHLAKRLDGHRGCVNSIHWNAEGTLLITGSDDCKLNIYSPGPHYKQLHNIRTGHSRNIFCAKFVPYTNDNTVVSCGMDGEIRCTQLGRERTSALIYSSPMHMVLKMSFLPGSGSVFLSTHQDGTVRLFDLRLRENNPENIAVDLRSERGERVAVNSLAMCTLGSYKFALACADPIVRLYDIRMTGGASTGQNITENDRYKCLTKYCPRSVLETHSKRDNYFSINVTGVDFNELGEIAATYSRVDAYVFSTQPGTHHKELTSETAPNIDSAYYQVQTGYVQSYKGHKNVRTFLKEISFLGGNDYVTTGSDCGHAFVWHKQTGKLVNMLKADDSVVNGVAPHPHLPYLATCGIDSDGKVWEPGSEYT